ncbi:MAG: class I SAM-dependent methyltransferase [Planctomycetes bacterium]|nr:class I SAM-dependent methyltransferase [Planctomycetota bacterium]
MPASDYEYRGLMAQGWDLLRGDTSGWPDRAFYLEIIRRSGQPVLDVGCGTGRLLLDYLAQGIDVDGVDNSPEMLALLHEKARALGVAPRTWEQPMESLAIPRRYRTVLVPSSSLQLVTDPEAAAAALRGLRSLLEPGGMLAASFMTLWREGEPLESVQESSALRASDGATLRRVTRSRFDPGSGCEHTEDLYQLRIEDRVVAEETHRRSPAVRSYTQAQAVDLLQRAGFSEVTVYSGFTFRPAEAADQLFCLVARSS